MMKRLMIRWCFVPVMFSSVHLFVQKIQKHEINLFNFEPTRLFIGGSFSTGAIIIILFETKKRKKPLGKPQECLLVRRQTKLLIFSWHTIMLPLSH